MTAPVERIPDALNAELSRQYDVIRLIGRGGMGAVWLARERSLDRPVAIKVLAGDEIGSSTVRDRFRREARIAARLVHPNIVPLHSFGETSDALYFVMGYVEGETLAVRLEREGRIAQSEALRLLSDIADALAFAHREGVVHRDVKPENILLEARSGRALLADFGVARVESGGTSVTMTGVAVGTPSYMSPEQALGLKEIDGRADLYALGVVGYRMLMGRLPFTAATVQGLLAQHAAERPADLTLAVADNDRGIARIIMRSLEKDPDARWARAEDFRDALQASVAAAVMPEELDRLDGSGTAMLLPAALFAEGMYLVALAGQATGSSLVGAQSMALMFDALLAGTLGLILGVRARPAARKFGWRAALRVAFHPPTFWSWWWPRALRRPGDLWDRLPAIVRGVRNIKVATALLMVGFTCVVVPIIAPHADDSPFWDAVFRTSFATAFLGFVVLVTGIVRRSKKAAGLLTQSGLSPHDATRFIELPNSATAAGWRNEQFMRVLAPMGAQRDARRVPVTPAELAAAVKELSRQLRGVGAVQVDECVAAAAATLAAIEGLEAEIQRLHQGLEPDESARLERRLAEVRDDPELRRYLESQRQMLGRLEERRREKEQRRDHLREQLRTLCLQLVDLSARASRGALDPELTARVRALSTDLTRSRDAIIEADRSALPPDRPRVTTLYLDPE